MPILKYIPRGGKNLRSCWLNSKARKEFSQNGEEGIIEAIFEIITPANKWCVEFGAWDGINMSNTCYFLKNKSWRGVHIEGNPARFQQLVANFSSFSHIYQFNELVGFTSGKDTLDDFLSNTPIPKEFDLLSIDIDGNDYHIWESLKIYRPRLLVIEINPRIPNDILFIQDRDMLVNQGSSLLALITLGKMKGYELVCVHHTNAFFVLKSEFNKFGITDNSIDAMKQDSGGRIFNTYDGTIYNTLGKLGWAGGGTLVAPDSLQYLPINERVFVSKSPR
jgi:hypothetical protein